MKRVLITTVPFADKNGLPLELLDGAGVEWLINPLGRKLSEDELYDLVEGFDAIIAGTEIISRRVMEKAKNLKLISRVGVGLDGVDMLAAEEMGIKVSYTPDAPAPAVAELTLGLMLNLLRSIHTANINMHEGQWKRIFGRRIAEVTIGVIGVGRIGSRVIRRVGGFGTPIIMANDQLPNRQIDSQFKINWSTKEEIYRNADVITLHVPLTTKTKNMVTKEQLLMMKKDALVINTARGGIINENDLADVLNSGHLAGAAIDVFEQEPYHGRLSSIKNCILTSHMGSMSLDCRARMELEATKEVARLAKGAPLEALVPQSEYDVQRDRL